jgi:hypothetical protein
VVVLLEVAVSALVVGLITALTPDDLLGSLLEWFWWW